MTNAEFAESIGIDPTKLSKSLNRIRRFSTFELAAIANQAGTTVDWLLTGTPPDRVLVAARAAAQAADVLGAVVQRAYALAEVEAALGLLLDRPPRAALPEVAFTGRYLEDAETMAQAVLDLVGGAGRIGELRTDPATVFEDLFDINVVFDGFDSGFDGLALRSAESRVVLVNMGTSWSRQRFTLAHEVGHVIAGDGLESGVCVDQDVMAGNQTEEKRANAFAAGLLMPQVELRDDLRGADGVDDATFGRLVGKYRVSVSAMAWRLKNLGFVDAGRRAQLGCMRLDRAARLGGWQADLGDLAMRQCRSRVPQALARAAGLAFAEGLVGPGLLATVLNTSAEEIMAGWNDLTRAVSVGEDDREAVFVP